MTALYSCTMHKRLSPEELHQRELAELGNVIKYFRRFDEYIDMLFALQYAMNFQSQTAATHDQADSLQSVASSPRYRYKDVLQAAKEQPNAAHNWEHLAHVCMMTVFRDEVSINIQELLVFLHCVVIQQLNNLQVIADCFEPSTEYEQVGNTVFLAFDVLATSPIFNFQSLEAQIINGWIMIQTGKLPINSHPNAVYLPTRPVTDLEVTDE